MTSTIAIDTVKAIEWNADNGATIHTYYAEGVSAAAGWFCFEVDTIAELSTELTTLGFDPTPFIADLPRG